MPATRPAARPGVEQLQALPAFASLSPERLRELAGISRIEHAARGSSLLEGDAHDNDLVFLLSGEVLIAFAGGGSQVVVGGTEYADRPINRREHPVRRMKAITEVDLLIVEDEVIDVLATWDQVAAAGEAHGSGVARAIRTNPGLISGTFSLSNLRNGLFAQLSPARIDELLSRFERLPMQRGDIVIREGDEGEHYFVIESGRCRVERVVGGVRVTLAELRSGDAFGEEALVSEARRNATVVATTEGELLRLGKRDFDELLRDPLLRRVDFGRAGDMVRQGAQWLDVRYPSEFQYDRLPGAINVPLAEVRNMFAVLDRGRDYVVYCQSGRRSAAAAFLFAQRGFNVWLLEGGLRAVDPSARRAATG